MIKMHCNFIKALIFMIVAVLCPKYVFAKSDSNVELEWEAIENAKTYDLEVQSTKNTFKFQVKKPIWAGRLSPGFFKMRVRARDKRSVPGEWSEFQEFKVYLDSPVFVYPVSGTIISSVQNDKQSVTFKWNKVFKALKYSLEVQGLDSTFNKKIETDDDHFTLDLPVGNQFKATLRATNEVLESHPDKIQTVEFIVIGKKLLAPQMTKPDSVYVREMRWSKSEFAQGYHYTLEKFDPNSQKFNLFDENKAFQNEVMPFKKEWPGGTYRLTVKSRAKYRPSSDSVAIRFLVKDGDRSSRAEELARLRESIERLTGWFGMASLLMNSVEYQNLNYDLTNTQVAYSAVGATLRAGLGYATKEKPWGYFLAAEKSTLSVNGFGNIDYNQFEVNSFFKIKPNDAGEFRQTAGIVYKELPDVTSSMTGFVKNNSILSALGFRYGVEYWHAITPKFGIQGNAHIFPLIAGQKTTNGQAFVPSTSMQAGFLASYRWNKNLTTLIGYAYRSDKIEYKTAPNTNIPFPKAEKNSVTLKGHYLNLFLEYQL